MEAAIAIIGLLFLLFIAAGVFVTVKAVQATKRGVDRTVAQARRSVEDTGLRARKFTQPGVTGELAQLRLSLRTSMRATQDALRGGVADDASLSEALGLFERLSAHGHELDDELRRLEREPDRAATSARMPELRERTQRITQAADSLRWAALDRARKFSDDDLAALNDQIDVEAGALRHWTREPLRDPAAGNAPDGGAGAGRQAAGTGSASGAPGGSWGPEAGEPQAIAAKDPRVRPSYPWQKARHGEGTT
ncbi:hypothetical protein [Streptomyces pinistramenti]|uniref:hypothetical protein n=1 Tax=Streptomyces pinistramenti TaxID=2884812 RepID=UPI001D0732DD|nr:hypothetical protein [Streptomyces pinistramenti]MCB5906768.1 hypothetical protein [Streptomyces pinistramenti]